MTKKSLLTLGFSLTLVLAGLSFAADQPQASEVSNPDVATVEATTHDASAAGLEAGSEAATDSTTSTTNCQATEADSKSASASELVPKDLVFTGGGLYCEAWNYAGCCPGNQKKSIRPCWDSAGHKTWQTMCGGTCPN